MSVALLVFARISPAAADPAVLTVDPAPGPVASSGLTIAPVGGSAAGVAPGADGFITSQPAATSTTPDGWTLVVGAKDERLRNVSPLTTALSSRDYEVDGVFVGALRGPAGAETPHGVLEVGYQIGCGIDMSTSQGVTLTDSGGVTPSLGLLGVDGLGPLVDGIAPVISTPVTSGVAIGLKPGIVNVVPVAKKEFTGNDPWVAVNGFHVKIDGCVGESFIRSYAVLTHSTPQSDSIRGYYGTTRKV